MTNLCVSIVTFAHPSLVTQRFAVFMQRAFEAFGVDCAIYFSPIAEASTKALLDSDVLIAITPLPLLNLTIDGKYLFHVFKGKIIYYAIDTLTHDISAWPSVRMFIDAMHSSPGLFLALPSKDAAEFVSSGSAFDFGRQLLDLPFASFPSPPSFLNSRGDFVLERFLVCLNIDGVYNLSELSRGLEKALEPFGFCLSQVARLKSALLADDCPSNPLGIVKETLQLPDNPFPHLNHLRAIDLVDSWLKSARRQLLAHKIVDEDLPIDIAGSGWSDLLKSSHSLRLLGRISHSDFSNIVPRYKGILNLDPNWDHGFHDRVYTALASGVYVITQANKAKLSLPDSYRPGVFAFRPSLADFESILSEAFRAQIPSSPPVFDLRLTWVDRVASMLRTLYS